MLPQRRPPGEFIFGLLEAMIPPPTHRTDDQSPFGDRFVYVLLITAGFILLAYGFLFGTFAK
jgi:hypothetical protein